MTAPLCRHCGKRPATRAKGLCRFCYYSPGVSALYPSASKYNPAKHGDGSNPVKQPEDAAYRCMHCGAWVCSHPLETCEDCTLSYHFRASTMPEVERYDRLKVCEVEL